MEYQSPLSQKLADWEEDTSASQQANGQLAVNASTSAVAPARQSVNGANGHPHQQVNGATQVNSHQQLNGVLASADSQPNTHQHTLARSITATGVGLHSGEEVTLTLSPAAPDTGLIFRRHDLADTDDKHGNIIANTIPALARHVSDVDFNTSIATSPHVRIATIEHVMAALAGADIDNAYIDVAGAELPAFDGSAAVFSDMIGKAGIAQQDARRQYLKVLKPISVARGKSRLTIAPSDSNDLRISTTIAFDEAFIGTSEYVYDHSQHNFAKELAAARTFCLYESIAPMHAKGYAFGGSLDNAIVIRDGCMLNKEPLRFVDEFVRHKTLDCLGDLRLAGYPLLGHVTAYRPGHRINAKLVQALLADKTAYAIVTAAEVATAMPVVATG